MATYHMPVIFVIQADSIEEARDALEEWNDSIDLDNDVPTGTEDIEVLPACELNDEGLRVLHLPAIEDDVESDDVDSEEEDFNDIEEEPS